MRTHRYSWALAIALLASCADYSVPDEVLYGQAVYTQAKPAYDFKPLTTYYLDRLAKVYEDDANNPTTIDLDSAQFSSVQTAIHANMTRLGYTELASRPVGPTPGAVGLQLVVLKGTGAVWYPGYWCDPYYYGYCYYDWYYAGSYKYGTVTLAMGDLSGTSTTGGLDLVWVAAMYGVASTPAYDIPRVVEAVNRAFGQSGELDTN